MTNQPQTLPQHLTALREQILARCDLEDATPVAAIVGAIRESPQGHHHDRST